MDDGVGAVHQRLGSAADGLDVFGDQAGVAAGNDLFLQLDDAAEDQAVEVVESLFERIAIFAGNPPIGLDGQLLVLER